MRILHVYRTYFPDTQGGLEETIRQIARTTRAQGAEVRVYTLSKNPHPADVEVDGVRVHRVQESLEIASCSIALNGRSRFRELVDWADVVHYHFPWPYADWLRLSTAGHRPSVLTYHSDIVRQKVLGRIYEPVMRRFLGGMDAIVCTSPNYLATSPVLARYRNVDVIPIGLTESSYPPVDDTFVANTEDRFGRDFFLFVGVLRYYKGLHILVDAIRHAPFRVIVAGAGPVQRALMAHARQQKVDNVEFAGYLNDRTKMALFKLARAVVLPSILRSEAFGVSLLEGAMAGKPLVSTEVGSGTSFVNVDGQTGLVVPPGSVPALRAAMETLWEQPSLAQQMGANARERYDDLFTGELMGERYMSLYSRVLTERRTTRHPLPAQRV